MRHDDVSTQIRQMLGQNIKALRERSGMSQSKFAHMVSMDRSYLNQLERGLENPTIDMLTRIADGLDVPVTHLLAGADQHPPHLLPGIAVKYRAVPVPPNNGSGKI